MKFVQTNLEIDMFDSGGQEENSGSSEPNEPHVALQESDMHYLLVIIKTDKITANSMYALPVMSCTHTKIPQHWNAGVLQNQFHKLNNPRETIVKGTAVKELEKHFRHQFGEGHDTRARQLRGQGKPFPQEETMVVPIARISRWMTEDKVAEIISQINACLMSQFEKLPAKITTTAKWGDHLTNAVDEVQKTYLAITPTKVS